MKHLFASLLIRNIRERERERERIHKNQYCYTQTMYINLFNLKHATCIVTRSTECCYVYYHTL